MGNHEELTVWPDAHNRRVNPRKFIAALLFLALGLRGDVLAIQRALEAGELDRASQLVGDAIKREPRNGGLFNLRGIIHARRDEIALARKDFGTAARLSPELTPAWQNLARACDQADELTCATDAWQQVLRTRPNDEEARHSLAADLRRLIISYERSDRSADALRTLERLSKLEPNNVADLLEMARLAERRKNYREALGYLAHARDIEPANARIHFLFGLIAGEMDLAGEAKISLEKALSIDPENPDYNYALGVVTLKTRTAGGATTYFQKFLVAKPADPNGHYALGLAYFAAGDYDSAKEQMLIAGRDVKFSGASDYYLGRIARIEGQFEEAAKRLRQAAERLPAFSESHTELARLALQQRDLENARSELSKAIHLAPESFQANEQLLVLYRRTKDPRAEKQADVLKKLDEERSRRAELMLRSIEVRP